MRLTDADVRRQVDQLDPDSEDVPCARCGGTRFDVRVGQATVSEGVVPVIQWSCRACGEIS